MKKAGIYTRRGDKGETALGTKERVSKSHYRIQALGSIDELNSVIGLGLTNCSSLDHKLFSGIQEDLFVIGSIISKIEDVELDQDRISYIEEHIDMASSELIPLKNFILPGGRMGGSWLHFARAVCRRAERDLVVVQEKDNNLPKNVMVYMNRLSDLLFTEARKNNSNGQADVLWSKESLKKAK